MDFNWDMLIIANIEFFLEVLLYFPQLKMILLFGCSCFSFVFPYPPLNMSQVYLRRNCEGIIDPSGEIWAAPYRWGCLVIAYKKSKFQKNKLAPIEVTLYIFLLLSSFVVRWINDKPSK